MRAATRSTAASLAATCPGLRLKKFSSLVLSNSPRSSLSNASFLGRRFFPVPPTLALMRATKPCFFPPCRVLLLIGRLLRSLRRLLLLVPRVPLRKFVGGHLLFAAHATE
jgi:hypothetical protein